MSQKLTAEQLEELLSKAHQVIIWTTQDTLRPGAAGLQHLIEDRQKYLRARIEMMASVGPLTSLDVLGCTCGSKNLHKGEVSDDCLYHYAASLQPWNHSIPWNCPTYYDGCNCPEENQEEK